MALNFKCIGFLKPKTNSAHVQFNYLILLFREYLNNKIRAHVLMH